MHTIQEAIEPTNKRKKADQLCGRLIIWDADTPQEDLVIVVTDYYYAKPDLSAQNGSKLYAPSVHVLRTIPDTSPIAQRFYRRYGFLPEYLSKKPLLN